jgi:hypothetical protein
MKNTRDIDYHEHHKLQTYRLVVGREELVLTNSTNHRRPKNLGRTVFLFAN